MGVTGFLRRARARLSSSLGVTAGRRARLVRSMLEGHTRGAVSYWLQLLLATGIAILGLVLNATGVVIGAMLISPLMGPMVELGLGLSVGSALMALRSFLRIVLSVVAVVAGSALITAALPFQQATAEIAARTAPTALDLLIAAFCALAAAFTTVRAASDTATAAAGTAIAIALVPPLCVVGFGVGTGDWSIASGATMLFVANFCAILLLAAVTFLVFGFSKVSEPGPPDAAGQDGRLIGPAVRWLHSVFGSRYSPILRFSMPVVLLAIVYLPLSRALREVTWQVRTRSAIERILKESGVAGNTVRSSITVERGAVAVQLMIVGRPRDALLMEEEIRRQLEKAAIATSAVEVRAVPDAEAVELAQRAQPTAIPPPPRADLAALSREVGEALAAAWPPVAGKLLRWRLVGGGQTGPGIELLHLGAPLAPSGEALLANLLSRELRVDLVARSIALPAELVETTSSPSAEWLAAGTVAIEQSAALPGVFVCVTLPRLDPPTRQRGRRHPQPQDGAATARGVLEAAARAGSDGRIQILPGDVWRVAVQEGPCVPPTDVIRGSRRHDADAALTCWSLSRGQRARHSGAMKASFRVWAPRARQVELETAGQRIPMSALADGWWTADETDAPEGTDYGFRIDGGELRPDPRSTWQPSTVHGPSRTVAQMRLPGPTRRSGRRPLQTVSSTRCTSAPSRPRGLSTRPFPVWII